MFCTLICCMDGRFIHIINEYIRANYRYEFVDTITDAGPANKIVNEEYLKNVEDKIVLRELGFTLLMRTFIFI